MTSVTPEFRDAQPPDLPAVPLDVELFAELALYRVQEGLDGIGPDVDKVRAAVDEGREIAAAEGVEPGELFENISVCLGTARLVFDEIVEHCETIRDDPTVLPADMQRDRGIRSRIYAAVLRIGAEMFEWSECEKPYLIEPNTAHGVCGNIATLALTRHWSESAYLTTLTILETEASKLAPEPEVPRVPFDVEIYLAELYGHQYLALMDKLSESAEISQDMDNDYSDTIDELDAFEQEWELSDDDIHAAVVDIVRSSVIQDIGSHMNAIDHAAETSDDTTQADREQSRVFAMLLETGTQIERWMNETEEVVWQSDEQKMCLDVVFTLTYGSKIPISVSNLIRELRQHANAPAKVTHEA